MKSSGVLDTSGNVTNSIAPSLLGARLILEDDDDFLEIYDSRLGPEGGQIIVRLDKDVPYMMFDRLNVFYCNEGMYALLSEGAKCIIYYDA
ncbi:MAG TPA: hypothetical protein ENI23_01540 [bacterium]|nr:hypothetical protein [bacterium]